jgi:drug/metabolite transporter (DMT)-like permease
MSYLKPLITLNYWFNLNPAPFVPLVWNILGILIILFLIASAVLKYLSYRYRKYPPAHRVFSRLGRAGLWVSVIAIFFYFFNFESLPTLSARFWWALIFIGAVVWKAMILLDTKKRYPLEKKVFLEKKEREKYL